MGCLSFIFSRKFLLSLFILSAIPIGIIITLEKAPPKEHVYQYHGTSWFRESATWDDLNRRFLVSGLEGGVGEIKVHDDGHDHDRVLDEITTVKDADWAGNSSLGLVIDRPRNRLLVVVTDLFGHRYDGLASYDLSTWQRLFLTHLPSPIGEKSLADDVDVDEEGNTYVTDAKGNKIWKVNVQGKLVSIIRSRLFTQKEWYNKNIALNGIVYHPDGYLLVIHTSSGKLYKIDLKNGEQVKLIKVEGSLRTGDDLVLFSPSKLVVSGNYPGRLVESTDGWETAVVVGRFSGMMHRLATAALVKDGKVYFSYLIGFGYPRKKHVIVEASFS